MPAAIDALARGASGLEAAEMRLWALAAHRQHGLLRGGDEGRALVESSDAESRRIGVRSPDRLAVMMVSGFGR